VTERDGQNTAQGFSNATAVFAKRKQTEVAHVFKITAQVQQLEDILTWQPSALSLEQPMLQPLVYLDFRISSVSYLKSVEKPLNIVDCAVSRCDEANSRKLTMIIVFMLHTICNGQPCS